MKSAFLPLLLGLMLSFALPNLGLEQFWSADHTPSSELAWMDSDSCRLPIPQTLMSPPPPVAHTPAPIDTLVMPFSGSLGTWVNWIVLAL